MSVLKETCDIHRAKHGVKKITRSVGSGKKWYAGRFIICSCGTKWGEGKGMAESRKQFRKSKIFRNQQGRVL